METLLKTAIDLALGALCGGAAFFIAFALTSWRGPVLTFKPLNCWPCLSFWLTLIFGAALMWFGAALSFSTLILYGFINFIYIHSKVKIVP